MITTETSQLIATLLAGYPAFASDYANNHPGAAQSEIINAYLSSTNSRTAISSTATRIAQNLNRSDLRGND